MEKKEKRNKRKKYIKEKKWSGYAKLVASGAACNWWRCSSFSDPCYMWLTWLVHNR